MDSSKTKKKLSIPKYWPLFASLVGIGASAIVLWATSLGLPYLETYRGFINYMIYIILGLGIPSDLTESPSRRPKFRIVVFAACFGCATAYFLPEWGHPNLAYLFGDASVIGFTTALIYSAIAEMLSPSS